MSVGGAAVVVYIIIFALPTVSPGAVYNIHLRDRIEYKYTSKHRYRKKKQRVEK